MPLTVETSDRNTDATAARCGTESAKVQHIEGTAGSQSPRHATAAGSPAAHSPREPHAQTLRRLLSDRDAAKVLGIGERTFADLVASADWLPIPIVLGPRLRRWDADELIEAARTRAPRGSKGQEPAQLRRARIERMKAGGTVAATA